MISVRSFLQMAAEEDAHFLLFSIAENGKI